MKCSADIDAINVVLWAIESLFLWNGARSSAYSGKPLPTYFTPSTAKSQKLAEMAENELA